MIFNFNLFEINLVNLVIVIGFLFWFLCGFFGGILECCCVVIFQELQDVDFCLKIVIENLSQVQFELVVVQQKVEKICVDGQVCVVGIWVEGEKCIIFVMVVIKVGVDVDVEVDVVWIKDSL